MNDDLISRAAAIRALEKEKLTPFVNEDRSLDPFSIGRRDQWYRDGLAIMNLPSAEPEQRKGKWIKMSDADGIYYCCSECGEELYRKWSFNIDYVLLPKKESIERINFCSNCGADMRERDGE